MSKDIIGTRIGIYNVLYECDHKTQCGHKLYRVKCSKCGFETDMMKANINRAKQCRHIGIGNIYASTTSDFNWSNQRLKHIFRHMKERCYLENNKDYQWYGAKGIKICDEWLNNPKNFEDWALLNGYNDNMTIDRKEENKDYCPDNCHWISLEDNAKHKSTTSVILVNGVAHTGRDWSKILGIGTNKINEYIRQYGLDNTIKFIEKYLDNPGLKPKHKQSYYNLYMTI